MAALEGARWGLTLAGEAALAQQLRALLGAGVLRLDPHLPLRRDLLAEAGLAAASLEGDWRGAVAVWLLEPSDEELQRAARAGVPVIVDATLAPGSHWLAAGARYVTYHHGAALTGFADGSSGGALALLFGSSERPEPAAPAAADLAVALALRDVATLPLRLARAAQTAAALANQLTGRALPLGPTALLLPPEAAAATPAPLGGVLPAVQPVQGGMLLTPGLADARQVRSLLHGVDRPAEPAETVASTEQPGQGSAATVTQPADTRPERRYEAQEDNTRSAQPAREEQLEGQAAEVNPNPAPEREREPRFSKHRPHERREQKREDRRDSRERGNGQQGNRRFERSERFAGGSRPERQQGELDRFVFEAPQPEANTAPQAPETPAPQQGDMPQPEQEQTTGTAPADQPEQTPAPAAEPRQERQDQRRSQDRRSGRQQQDRQPGRHRPAPAGERQGPAEDAVLLPPDLPVAQAGSGKPDPTADLTEEQSAVFARLRDWRNAEASRQEISRFIVASNATLAEIARQVPYTIEDLRSVKGMGPARVSKYGEAIVHVVRGTRS